MNVTIQEAKARWSRLIRRAAMGEEIVICRRNEPIARLVPERRLRERVLGIDEGVFEVPEDFDAPLAEDAFGGCEG